MFPDATLHTERLTLRPFQDSDIDAIVEAANDPLTQTWLPLPHPYTVDHARGWCREGSAAVRISGDGLVRAIEFDGKLAGCIDLKHTDWAAMAGEIGYWSVPGVRGQGVMVEAVAGLTRWALTDRELQRVQLRIAPGNKSSLRVAEKAGFVREGVARSAGFVHAGRVDLEIWSLIRSDLGLPTAQSAP
jgi:RimJ/RimL family protein N-acetyltransferase